MKVHIKKAVAAVAITICTFLLSGFISSIVSGDPTSLLAGYVFVLGTFGSIPLALLVVYRFDIDETRFAWMLFSILAVTLLVFLPVTIYVTQIAPRTPYPLAIRVAILLLTTTAAVYLVDRGHVPPSSLRRSD